MSTTVTWAKVSTNRYAFEACGLPSSGSETLAQVPDPLLGPGLPARGTEAVYNRHLEVTTSLVDSLGPVGCGELVGPVGPIERILHAIGVDEEGRPVLRLALRVPGGCDSGVIRGFVKRIQSSAL